MYDDGRCCSFVLPAVWKQTRNKPHTQKQGRAHTHTLGHAHKHRERETWLHGRQRSRLHQWCFVNELAYGVVLQTPSYLSSFVRFVKWTRKKHKLSLRWSLFFKTVHFSITVTIYKAICIVDYLFNPVNLGLYSVCHSLSPQAQSTMQIASLKYAQRTKSSLLSNHFCGHQNATTWKKCEIQNDKSKWKSK